MPSMKNIFLTFIPVALSITCFSAEASTCPDLINRVGNIQIQQTSDKSTNECTLSLHPRNAWETLIYRDYLFSSDGLMMIFGSFNPSDSATATGAREYYFFPQEFKGFQWEIENESLKLTGFQGITFHFSLKTGDLESMSGAKIKVSPEVQAENQTGVEILSFEGLYLDSGFLVGASPSSEPRRGSQLKNSLDQSCRLLNGDIFHYIGQQVNLRPQEDVLKVAKSKCTQFQL